MRLLRAGQGVSKVGGKIKPQPEEHLHRKILSSVLILTHDILSDEVAWIAKDLLLFLWEKKQRLQGDQGYLLLT